MIAKISKNRTLKKITMAAATVVMGVGLATSLSSFDDSGGGDSGTGWFDKERFFSQSCGAYTWTKTEYKNSSGQVIGSVEYHNGALFSGEVMAQGTYTTAYNSSGSGAASQREGWQCTSTWYPLYCTPCPDPCGSSCG